jgi:hypothetical protein
MNTHPKSDTQRAAVAHQRLVRRLGNIIADEVAYFNGWKVDAEAQREACEKAARRILKMKRFRSPNSQADQP